VFALWPIVSGAIMLDGTRMTNPINAWTIIFGVRSASVMNKSGWQMKMFGYGSAVSRTVAAVETQS
jgi:hypothetical protein